MKRAVYPGSFDPITFGHINIIERASRLFDEVIVLVAHSSAKNYLFSAGERKSLVENSFTNNVKVIVETFEGLTVDFAKSHGANAIVRGIRAVSDFEEEMTLALMNKRVEPEIETVVIFSDPQFSFISSRLVKEIARHGGNTDQFLPPMVGEKLKAKINR